MADIPTLITRARLELGDLGSPFQAQFPGDGVTTLITLPQHPVNGVTLNVSVTNGGVTTPLVASVNYSLDDRNGILTLVTAPPAGATLTVSGTAYSYLTDNEWMQFLDTALEQHTYKRTDPATLQSISLANLPVEEEYPVCLYATVLATYALVSDASFNVDVTTPEGIHIPNSQLAEQLWRLLANRLDQYNKICAAMNIGLFRTEMMDLRRISYLTGRLVPLYQEQEFQDTRFPMQEFPPIDTLGGRVEPAVNAPVVPLTAYANQDWTYTLTLNQDITGYTVYGSIRRYPASLTPMIYMTVKVLNVPTGQIQLSLDNRLTYYCGTGKFYDIQLVSQSDGSVQTVQQGTFDAIRQGLPGAPGQGGYFQ